jgi:hypothetical protein
MLDGNASAVVAQLVAAAAARRERTRRAIDRVSAEAAAASQLGAARPDVAAAASIAAWVRRCGLAAAEEAECGFAIERDGWRMMVCTRDHELRRLRAALTLAQLAAPAEPAADAAADSDDDSSKLVAHDQQLATPPAPCASPLFTAGGKQRKVVTLSIAGTAVRVAAMARASLAAAAAVRADVEEGGMSRKALGLLPQWPHEPFGPAQFIAALNAGIGNPSRLAHWRQNCDPASQRAKMRYVLERVRRTGRRCSYDPTWPVNAKLAALLEAEVRFGRAGAGGGAGSDDDEATPVPSEHEHESDEDEELLDDGPPFPLNFPKRRRSGYPAAHVPEESP